MMIPEAWENNPQMDQARREPGSNEIDWARWGREGMQQLTPLWMLKYLPNMPASHIAILNDLRGPNNSLTLRARSRWLTDARPARARFSPIQPRPSGPPSKPNWLERIPSTMRKAIPVARNGANSESESPPHTVDAQQIEAMVERLAQRMRENPDDPQGWVMLGRSYAVMERFPEAAKAYAAAVERVPNDAQLLADYADTLAMAQGRSLQGEPEKLIARALAIDPENVKALALGGTIAFEKGDYARAATLWERIVRDAPADSPLAQSVRASIEKARGLAAAQGSASTAKAPAVEADSAPAKAAGPDQAVPASGTAVSGSVQLAPELVHRNSLTRIRIGPLTPPCVFRSRRVPSPGPCSARPAGRG